MRTAILSCPILVLVLGAAGCGKVHLPGSSADATPGAPDSAGPGPVTVRVLSFDGLRTPLEGVKVGFFAPDGGHQATVETDGDGAATSDLEAGGAVAAFLDGPPAGVAGPVVRLVLGVAPGDEIVIAGDSFHSGEPPVTMNVVLPALAGSVFYDLSTSCGNYGSNTTTVAISFYPECDNDTFSFVATASGDAGRHYLRGENVPVVASGTYEAPGSWQMTPNRPFLFTEVPDEAGTVDVGVFGVRTGDHQIDVHLLRDSAVVAEDMITLHPDRIPNYDETMIWSTVRAEQPALGTFNYVRWLGPDDPTDSNLGELKLPWMTQVIYDNASRGLDWRLIGSGEFDATYVTLIASINDGKVFTEVEWFVVAPPGIEEIVLPELPDELSRYFISDPEYVNAFGQIVDSDQLDGYDAARPKGFDPSYFPAREPLGSLTRSSFSGGGVD